MHWRESGEAILRRRGARTHVYSAVPQDNRTGDGAVPPLAVRRRRHRLSCGGSEILYCRQRTRRRTTNGGGVAAATTSNTVFAHLIRDGVGGGGVEFLGCGTVKRGRKKEMRAPQRDSGRASEPHVQRACALYLTTTTKIILRNLRYISGSC